MTNPLPDTAITDEQVDRLSEGDFYHYMLDKDHITWARHANRISKLGLNALHEEILAGWFANAMCAVVDRPTADYIRARLDSEHKEDAALIAAAQVGKDSPTAADMRAFGASHIACFKWPDDTPEHRLARAAYCEGAFDAAGPVPTTPGEPLPCDVHLPPNTYIRKGCDFETALSGIRARAKFHDDDTRFPEPTTPGRADDGWQLVPKAPTSAMIASLKNPILADGIAELLWSRMLAASPPPPPPIQCTCGQSGHGNAHDPGCPMSDYRPVQSERQERLAESGEQDNELIAQLRHPIGYGGVNSEDAYEKFDELRLKAADRIATLTQALADMTQSRDDAFSDAVRRNNDAADAKIELSVVRAELAEAEKVIERFARVYESRDAREWLERNRKSGEAG